MRRVHVRRLVFVDLIFLQQRVGVAADVLELVEDDEVRVAVGADDLREWIVGEDLQHKVGTKVREQEEDKSDLITSIFIRSAILSRMLYSVLNMFIK